MAVYTPDEKGDIATLENVMAESINQMPTGDLGAAFAKMLITLLALVLLLFISYWFLRKIIQNRLQKGVGNAAIQVIEKRMISPKTMLYLVEVDNKKVLLAESHLEVKRLEGWEGSEH